MQYRELFDAINSEYDTDMAILVVGMYFLNMAEPVLDSDWRTNGDYETRCINKFNDVFWQQKQDDPTRFELAIELWKKIHIWDSCNTMQGLNGCVYKSFKELLIQ